ncbi:hypothetical protein SUNI508_10133 [Seiridium unicorne]|uniref:Uncharacterized protein n=1 Tax=Seiridium unicorne TaxID=138068 RepID=A0ABR2UMH4_9PEZI
MRASFTEKVQGPHLISATISYLTLTQLLNLILPGCKFVDISSAPSSHNTSELTMPPQIDEAAEAGAFMTSGTRSDAPDDTEDAMTNGNEKKVTLSEDVKVIDDGPGDEDHQHDSMMESIEPNEAASDSASIDTTPSKETSVPSVPQMPPSFTETNVLPKKRGRPRKYPLPDSSAADARPPAVNTTPVKRGRPSLANSPPVANTTPARKRGRPPKSAATATIAMSDAQKSPTSSDKRLMASVRRSSRGKEVVAKRLFRRLAPASRTQSPVAKPQYGTGLAPDARMTPTVFTPINTSGRPGTGPPASHPAFASYGRGSGPINEPCSCDTIKSIMQEVFFKNAVQEQDVWVVPKAAALEMHHYLGGGAPAPKGDLVITNDKLDIIRRLLF